MTKPKPLVTNIIIPMVALPLSQVKEKPKCGKNATATRTKKDELVVGLVRGLGVVFAAFAEDVGADVQGGALLFCLVG
jgi:hypothetical protein